MWVVAVKLKSHTVRNQISRRHKRKSSEQEEKKKEQIENKKSTIIIDIEWKRKEKTSSFS